MGSEIKGRARLLVYLNHFIVGWDDNIWWFALGLFLVEITPESLTFTATYGLVAGCAVLLFGTVVGDWVDRTPRLTVARVSVVVQNSALIVCSILIYLVIEYKTKIATVLPNEGLLHGCYALIIVIAIISNLTNMGRKTAIERDWIVEICDSDKDVLATVSATMRRISLLTMVIVPIITGQILSRTSHSTGALVIAGWNFLTIFIEYYLLRKIYEAAPQLQRMKIREDPNKMSINLMHGVETATEFVEMERQTNKEAVTENGSKDDARGRENIDQNDKPQEDRKHSFTRSLCASFITLHKGWNIYRRYDVAFAGFGLASLYLTVLGFDGITTGFAYSQGLSEDLIGGLLASAAFTGIIGTFLYPIVRKKFGLQRTGLYALTAQISSLTLCIVSIWCPGSPFDPLYFSKSASSDYKEENNQITHLQGTNTSGIQLMHMDNVTNASPLNDSVNSTYGLTSYPETVTSYVSISLLMTGIIGARVGLWTADLTIQQLFLETVIVTERGIVSGVQNAINQLMDMLKFAIVLLLPVPEVFGFLVIISFCFICLGWTMFAIFVKKSRGYLLPCNKPITKGTT